MIIFRRIKGKLYLAKDKYEPTYIIEACKIGPDIMKLVEHELSENAFDDLQQHRPEIVSQIQSMFDHRWIESEKVQRDLGGAALVDWILKYDNTSFGKIIQ